MKHTFEPCGASLRELKEELAVILGVPGTRLPQVFRANDFKALKIGITFDILALYPHTDPGRLRHWLGRYTSTKGYLRRISKGAHRHDLGDRNVQPLDLEARCRARQRLGLVFAAEAAQMLPPAQMQPPQREFA